MKKRDKYRGLRMILGGGLGIIAIVVAAGILAVQIKPELKNRPPWSWFAATPFEQAYVCKQDVNLNTLCNDPISKPAGLNENIIQKGSPAQYRVDFYMPLP